MRVLYATGTRADFGLMASTLTQLDATPGLEVGIAATGMHLDTSFGSTIEDIEATGLPIVARIETPMRPRTGLTVARATSLQVAGFADALADWSADCLLVLGDRPEMLAAALAAALQSIPVWHLHGGERSGSIDESIRHAISKLAHVHCVATRAAAGRLVNMGEDPQHIHVIGAPGLDAILAEPFKPREALERQFDLNAGRSLCVAVYHPVTQEQGSLYDQMQAVLAGALEHPMDIVLLRPNADAGGDEIDAAIGEHAHRSELRMLEHLVRADYLSLLRHAHIMIGNSSSGIIEAASFGLPVVDIGGRQNLRERGDNVTWAPAERGAVSDAIARALTSPRPASGNIYGDGSAGQRLCTLMSRFEPTAALLEKKNAY